MSCDTQFRCDALCVDVLESAVLQVFYFVLHYNAKNLSVIALNTWQLFCTNWNLVNQSQLFLLLASMLKQSSIRTSSSTYGYSKRSFFFHKLFLCNVVYFLLFLIVCNISTIDFFTTALSVPSWCKNVYRLFMQFPEAFLVDLGNVDWSNLVKYTS